MLEVGTPTSPEVDEAGGASESEEALFGSQQASSSEAVSTASVSSASGYYQVRWEDIANIDLNKTRAKLSWTYNGTCVLSSTASGYWWWRTLTGWLLDDPYSYAWKTTSDCSHFAHARGHFTNPAFCYLRIVETYAKDVRFRGGYAGGIGGYLGSAYYQDSCAPLHWVDTLVKN